MPRHQSQYPELSSAPLCCSRFVFEPNQCPSRSGQYRNYAGLPPAQLFQLRRRSPTEWQSARVQAADVPPNHPTYSAVSQVVAAGVLPLADGTFAPARPVSGTELTAAADRLEALAAAAIRPGR